MPPETGSERGLGDPNRMEAMARGISNEGVSERAGKKPTSALLKRQHLSDQNETRSGGTLVSETSPIPPSPRGAGTSRGARNRKVLCSSHPGPPGWGSGIDTARRERRFEWARSLYFKLD